MLTRRAVCRSLALGSLAGLTGAGRARAATANAMSMQAAWVNDAEFMGYFVGIQNGFYAANNVDLKYLSGGPDVIPESALLAGKAALALTTPDTTIRAITSQGAKFKIIGAQFQKSPIGVVSLASSPIRTVKALEGKILAVPPVNMAGVIGMLRINGIAKSSVRIVPYQFDPTPLIKGEIDASVDFVTDVPYTIADGFFPALRQRRDTVCRHGGGDRGVPRRQSTAARALAQGESRGVGRELQGPGEISHAVQEQLAQWHRPRHRERHLHEQCGQGPDRHANRHLLHDRGRHRRQYRLPQERRDCGGSFDVRYLASGRALNDEFCAHTYAQR
jgi:hypothetical protein